MLILGSIVATCADPGNLVGEGGPGPSDIKKKALTLFFCFFVFLLVLSFTEVKWLLSKKTKSIIFQGSREVQHFPGGGGGSSFFQGVPIAYTLYHITNP